MSDADRNTNHGLSCDRRGAQESGGSVWRSRYSGGMNDYDRIAAAIEFLNSSFRDQPSLDEIAAKAGLSAPHFQRLFRRWAGVSPKKFLQCLTVQAAKQRLQQGASVLDASLDSGLSGPGRLHDLTVNLESASPGEIKSGGADWTIRFGFAASPFGLCLIADSPRGILKLAFVVDADERAAETLLREDWRRAMLSRDDSHATALMKTIFNGNALPADRSGSSLRCLVRGTEFQVRVWRALLELPLGCVASYGDVARHIGRPGAVRAVGTAIGQNSVGYLIPCHRVIRATGVVGEYRWGSIRKRLLIGHELAHTRCDRVDTPE